ncbi:T9SS type A sorting domain-containing protein [Candidatus Latescibacterota bacterium]
MSTLSFAQDEVVVNSIIIFSEETEVIVGEEIKFTSAAYDAEENEVDAEITCSVEGDIGEINEDGESTTTNADEGYVVATVGKISEKASVTVDEYEVIPLRMGENDTVYIIRVQFPLNILNGMKLYFPEGSTSDEITFDFTIPTFAHVDNIDNKVSFEKDIISGVSFEVVVEGEVVSPYYFDEPIEVTLPYDKDLLDELGINPENLDMFYYTESGKLVKEGITDVVVNSEKNVITGNFAHFSDIAVAPKSTGPNAIEENTLPDGFMLSQNYPNPFNPATTIEYSIPHDTHVTLTIYNLSGQVVNVMKDEYQQAGKHSVTWDASDMPSGLYFYTLKANGISETRKMLLVK